MTTSEISNRDNWIFEGGVDVFTDKNKMVRTYIMQMLNRTLQMFEYEGLPENIRKKDLELQLQCGGFSTWKVVNDELYTFRSGLGGKPNPYYLPTKSIVANPALNYNESLEIGKDCVVMLNDYLYTGIMPILTKYANLLVEAEITLKYALINARVPALITADNDTAYESALQFYKDIVDGEKYGIISTKALVDGIKSHDFYKQPYIKDVIESIQYLKGSAFNEIGINAAFNMKREAINEAEAALNEDILYPYIDTMLECRQYGLEQVKDMYGYDIKVRLNSVWENNRKFDDLQMKKVESEIIENEKIINGEVEVDSNEDNRNSNGE